MTEPLPDPSDPEMIRPHTPQDDRDIWEIHDDLPPLPYVDEEDVVVVR